MILINKSQCLTANIAQRGDTFFFSIPSPFQYLQQWIKTRSKNPADAILAKRWLQCFGDSDNLKWLQRYGRDN